MHSLGLFANQKFQPFFSPPLLKNIDLIKSYYFIK